MIECGIKTQSSYLHLLMPTTILPLCCMKDFLLHLVKTKVQKMYTPEEAGLYMSTQYKHTSRINRCKSCDATGTNYKSSVKKCLTAFPTSVILHE